MNTLHSISGTVNAAIAVFLGTIMLATVAQADWLSPAFYGDELNRCAVELRAELNTTGVNRLKHNVIGIEKIGVWYVFDILTEMTDDTDTIIGRVKTRCKAHRWNERLSVEIKNLLPKDYPRVASND